MSSRIARVLIWQFCVTAVAAVGVFFHHEQAGANSAVWGAIFGGLIAMILSLWLGARLKRLDRRLSDKQAASAAALAFGFAPRMLLVLVSFWLGIALLGLSPLPMIVAFSAAYLVYWVELYRTRLG